MSRIFPIPVSIRGARRELRQSTPSHRGMPYFFALFIIFSSNTATAVEPVWSSRPLQYDAQNTPLPELLRQLFNAEGMIVTVRPEVKGRVNGIFHDSAKKIFLQLVDAYGLVWYYDGSVMSISTSADMRTQSLDTSPMRPAAALALLSRLNLLDKRFPLRQSNNALLVSGPSRYVDTIAAAIATERSAQLQRNSGDDATIEVFPLKYAQAQDTTLLVGNREQFIPGVATTLRELMGRSRFLYSRRPGVLQPVATSVPPLPTLASLTGNNQASIPVPQPLPPLAMPGETRTSWDGMNITADIRTNSVVVHDLPSMMPAYAHAIAALDKPQDLVQIDATVLDLSANSIDELGVDWQFKAGHNGGGLRNPPGSSPLNGGMPGTFAIATLIGNSANFFFARIKALAQAGKARILSRPRILTLNNQQAILGMSNSVHVRVAGDHSTNLYEVDAGLRLLVTPFILPDEGTTRRVRLNIEIDDGNFDRNDQVDNIPAVRKHHIATQAFVRNGESLIIGGYQYELEQSGESGIPVLRSIPYIGGLFRSRSGLKNRFERLFIITPRLDINTLQQAAQTADASEALRDAARQLTPPSLPQPYLEDDNASTAMPMAIPAAMPAAMPAATPMAMPAAIPTATPAAIPTAMPASPRQDDDIVRALQAAPRAERSAHNRWLAPAGARRTPGGQP
ncbi:type III secretion system outer membrane ring subunit SctC [Paraburkholderia hayleyella]|uniref:type III secretion system outer membrane ring subunit SctC n=1 Tax=Paraburkholderia hayleyella TaxID=2152889 RepID=UPI001290EF86|nr:type III secretion system outer membrane ring subunit SctC [Paraburkholderia hayleyella]